jgi:hypothetical protein
VRFYHEKFQKDKPELLHQIKRATKTDQQSKDEVESLKHDVAKLKEALSLTSAQYDQKLAELSYECNRRISSMNVEYDKLAALVHSVIASQDGTSLGGPGPAGTDLLHSLSQAAVSLQNHLRQPGNGITAPAGAPPPGTSSNTKRPAPTAALGIAESAPVARSKKY